MESSSGADVLPEEETAVRYFYGVDRLILVRGKLGLASRLVAI
jgi:hypothetical protein